MTSPSPLSLGAPFSLGDPSVLHTARMDRLALGVNFTPSTTALGAVSGIVHGPPGSVGELTLVDDSTLRVDPFVAVIQGTHNTRQGQYVVPNEQQRDLAVAARDASQTRRSLIVVRVADSAEAGVAPSTTTNGAWLERVDGALAASNPALPPLPANAVALGELTIPSAANSGTPVTLTPYRPRTGARHGILPVFDDASTIPGHGSAPGSYVGQHRDHPARGLERWNGTAWGQPLYDSGQINFTPGVTVGAQGAWYRRVGNVVEVTLESTYNGSYVGQYVFTTLPAGFRPSVRRFWQGVAYGSGPFAFSVSPDGTLRYAGNTATYTGALMMATYLAAPGT